MTQEHAFIVTLASSGAQYSMRKRLFRLTLIKTESSARQAYASPMRRFGMGQRRERYAAWAARCAA